MPVGRSQFDPYVVLIERIELALQRSRLACRRRPAPRLKIFDARKSLWYSRSSYIVPGAMSCTAAVPAAPDARLRPSDGLISAFVYVRLAVIIGPGRLWNVAASCTPPHGSG